MADSSDTEIVVTHTGDDFTFAIPAIHDDIKQGLRSRALRQAIVGPLGDYSAAGLDDWTNYQVDACATFEVLLRKSSATWPWSKTAAGAPIVDSSKFPLKNAADVATIYAGFRDKLNTFRQGGAAENTPNEEAVAYKPGT